MPLAPCPACQQEIPAGTLFCPQCGRVDAAAAAAESRNASRGAGRRHDSVTGWLAGLLAISVITLWGVQAGTAAASEEAPPEVAHEQPDTLEREPAPRRGRVAAGGGGARRSRGGRSAIPLSRILCPYIPEGSVAAPGQEAVFEHCRDRAK